MDPSAIIDDPNWIGVAICVQFVTHGGPMNLGDIYDYSYWTLLYGVNNVYKSKKRYSEVSIHLKKDLMTIELGHLLTVFYSRERFIDLLGGHRNTMHDLDEFEFETCIHNQGDIIAYLDGLRFSVKNCGYRWVLKEDLQQFNSNMFFSANSSSRKSKLLTSD